MGEVGTVMKGYEGPEPAGREDQEAVGVPGVNDQGANNGWVGGPGVGNATIDAGASGSHADAG